MGRVERLDGSGDGYGSGYGYGYGSGDGSGDGYGSGETLGKVGGHRVALVWPGYVTVGCQLHTVAWWREHWAGVARAEGLDVSQAEVDALLATAEGAAGSSGR